MILGPAELEEIRAHAAGDYPSECCGVVLARGEERRLVACRNAQDELHRVDPVRYPRDARTAYTVAGADLLAIARAEDDGWRVVVVYHSHADAGAYFSETDRRQALLAGEPIHPGAAYVVVSVVGGRVAGEAAFRWDAARGDFEPVPLAGSA